MLHLFTYIDIFYTDNILDSWYDLICLMQIKLTSSEFSEIASAQSRPQGRKAGKSNSSLDFLLQLCDILFKILKRKNAYK